MKTAAGPAVPAKVEITKGSHGASFHVTANGHDHVVDSLEEAAALAGTTSAALAAELGISGKPLKKLKLKGKAAVAAVLHSTLFGSPAAGGGAKPKQQHDWEGWISDAAHAADDKDAWLDHAPNGAVVPLAGGGHAWKAAKGHWHDAQGHTLSPQDLAGAVLHPGAVEAVQGLGPNGQTYPKGTTWTFHAVTHNASDVLQAQLGQVFPGATVSPNQKMTPPGEWWSLSIPVTTEVAGLSKEDLGAKLLPLIEAAGLKPHPNGVIQHIGGTFAYANVMGDLAHVVKTEVVPKPLYPTGAQTSVKLGDEAVLAGPSPRLGHVIHGDSDLIRDQYVRVLKREGGVREVTWKMTEWGAEALIAAMKPGAKQGEWKIGEGTWDPAEGAGSLTPGVVLHELPATTLSTPKWTASMVSPPASDSWALAGAVRLIVPAGVSVEDAMTDFATKMGMPQLAAEPTADDVERLKLARMLWSAAPQAHDKLAAGGKGKLTADALRKALHNAGISDEDIAAAEVVVKDGHLTVRMDDGDQFVARGHLGFYHNWYTSDPADLVTVLTEKGGTVSTALRWQVGTGGKGFSAPADMAAGGADSVFNYMLKSSTSSASGFHSGNGLHIVTGVDTLERTDWHSAGTDNYGNTHASNHYFKNRPGRQDDAQLHQTEYMVRGATGLNDIRAIVCDTSGKRNAIIAEFKKRGVITIGGVPVEDVVVTSMADAKKAVTDHWAATKLARQATREAA